MEGNQMKMREALNDIVGIAKIALNVNCVGNSNDSELWNVIDKAKAAISEPPRNCDVGTAEEQMERHCSMCVAITKNGTKGCDYSKCNSCFAKWGQMPYEEVK